MAATYVLATTTFAGLCGFITLLSGGTIYQAAFHYFVSGMLLMVTLISISHIMGRNDIAPDQQR